MKIKTIITTLIISSFFSINANNYLLTLEDKHYKNYINIKTISDNNNNVSAGLGTPYFVGWTNFAEYGNPSISDSDFVNAVANMQTGIKIVNGTNYAFISADKLRNANCFNITQVTSLQNNNGEPYPHLFHNEASGCGNTGLDYDKLYLKTYNVIYNHTGYWDEISGSLPKDSSTKFYIY